MIIVSFKVYHRGSSVQLPVSVVGRRLKWRISFKKTDFSISYGSRKFIFREDSFIRMRPEHCLLKKVYLINWFNKLPISGYMMKIVNA